MTAGCQPKRVTTLRPAPAVKKKKDAPVPGRYRYRYMHQQPLQAASGSIAVQDADGPPHRKARNPGTELEGYPTPHHLAAAVAGTPPSPALEVEVRGERVGMLCRSVSCFKSNPVSSFGGRAPNLALAHPLLPPLPVLHLPPPISCFLLLHPPLLTCFSTPLLQSQRSARHGRSSAAGVELQRCL